MVTLPTVSEALKTLTKRNELHEKVMLFFMVALGIFGLGLLIYAFLSKGPERIAGIVGGVLFEALILLPYNRIQSIRNQNIVIGMLAAIIDRFQDKVDSKTLNELIKDLLGYALKG